MICTVCNRHFEAKRKDARFCSSTCRSVASRATDKPATDNGSPPATDNAPFVTDKSAQAAELYAEAHRLVGLQQKERGWTKDSEGRKLLKPYRATPERETRAKRIIELRRQAALIEFPV